MTDTTQLGFVGDLHGRLPAFEDTLSRLLWRGCTSVVQVGDFWMYDNPRELAKLERIITRLCRDTGTDPDAVDYRFIDGNHENYTRIDPDGEPVAVSEHVTYMPRGSRATLAGHSVAFLGGASSVDRELRTEGKDWWPAENITAEQAERTPAADILVTHCPSNASFERIAATDHHAASKSRDVPDQANRERIDAVIARTKPRLHVHGHLHAFDYAPGSVALARELFAGSVVILDGDKIVGPVGRRPDGDDIELGTLPV